MTIYMFFIRNVTYANIFLEMFRTPRDDKRRVEMFRTPYLAVRNVSYPGNEPAKCFIPRQQITRPGMQGKK